ncbi:hypothetical protein DSO57_1031460 [Entomophthora muscae]|uniref:Uncharacterized protein n=2 Tax=Entomophthora muscae TaxID=34485 RepID=A0ACC2RQG6_9FUNG|nr:hypothetical protein DSO57_1035721 [Entomophthora muscae]KAJ9056588.1 hypothetical protein DSO57_1031460 [Entomophthora muscae]
MENESKKKMVGLQRGFKPSILKGANASNGLPGALPPTVILEPSNKTSGATKYLELFEKIRIGRQVSPKTEPTTSNGFFNSKVLSRTHAEIWCENNTVFIRDAKSSNGTYLNSVRLSGEGQESSPHKLSNGDLLEFGVDILNNGGETLYHRVSCKVQITFPAPQSKSTATPKIETPEPYNALPDIDLLKEKPHSSDHSKMYNPILQTSTPAPQSTKIAKSPPVQTTLPALVPLNPSATAVIPKAILGSLQEEARLASQEGEDLSEILTTITELMETYQLQLAQLRAQESKRNEKFTEELSQKDALYQRLESSTSKREALLIDESKLHLQELHTQRQINQKLLSENSNLFVALVQHCPEFSEHNIIEKVLENCACKGRETEALTSTIKYYENELARSLANNLELKAENQRYRDCLKSLSLKVEELSHSMPSISQNEPCDSIL